MERKAFFTVEIHPKSSIEVNVPDEGHRFNRVLDIKVGTNLVLNILRTMPAKIGTRDSGYNENLWLELPQEGLEVSENEIIIKEWLKLAFQVASMKIVYFSSNGYGILKIRRQKRELILDDQKLAFHGLTNFHFSDPLFHLGESERDINWTF